MNDEVRLEPLRVTRDGALHIGYRMTGMHRGREVRSEITVPESKASMIPLIGMIDVLEANYRKMCDDIDNDIRNGRCIDLK